MFSARKAPCSYWCLVTQTLLSFGDPMEVISPGLSIHNGFFEILWTHFCVPVTGSSHVASASLFFYCLRDFLSSIIIFPNYYCLCILCPKYLSFGFSESLSIVYTIKKIGFKRCFYFWCWIATEWQLIWSPDSEWTEFCDLWTVLVNYSHLKWEDGAKEERNIFVMVSCLLWIYLINSKHSLQPLI